MRRIGLGGMLLGLFLALACNAPFAEPTALAPPTLGTAADAEPDGSALTPTATLESASPATAPAGYVAPLMQWLRGADASLTQYDDRVVTDAVIEVARK